MPHHGELALPAGEGGPSKAARTEALAAPTRVIVIEGGPKLPPELWLQIMLWLDMETLDKSRGRVSKQWNALLDSVPIQKVREFEMQKKAFEDEVRKKWRSYANGTTDPDYFMLPTPPLLMVVGHGRLYTTHSRGEICVWSTLTRYLVKVLHDGVDRIVNCLAVGPDGKLYSSTTDNSVTTWDRDTYEAVYTLEKDPDDVSTVVSIAVAPNNKVYVGTDIGDVYVWSGTTGTLLYNIAVPLAVQVFGGHSFPLLTVGPDDSVYVLTHGLGISVWSGIDGAKIQDIVVRNTGRNHTMAVGPNNKVYLAGAGPVRVFDGRTGDALYELGEGAAEHAISMIAVGPDNVVYMTDTVRGITVWSGRTGARLGTDRHDDSTLKSIPVGSRRTAAREVIQRRNELFFVSIAVGPDKRLYTSTHTDKVYSW
jgi:WD40 repeat protein